MKTIELGIEGWSISTTYLSKERILKVLGKYFTIKDIPGNRFELKTKQGSLVMEINPCPEEYKRSVRISDEGKVVREYIAYKSIIAFSYRMLSETVTPALTRVPAAREAIIVQIKDALSEEEEELYPNGQIFKAE